MPRINLNTCKDSAITFATGTTLDSIKIEFTSKKSIKPVFCEEQQIEQVMINLIVNASHAIEQYSSPTISVKIKQIESYVIVSLKDNSPRIPTKILRKVWDPF